MSDLRRGLPIGLRGKICIPRACMIGLERTEGDQRDELVKGRKKEGKKDENKQSVAKNNRKEREKKHRTTEVQEDGIHTEFTDILHSAYRTCRMDVLREAYHA